MYNQYGTKGYWSIATAQSANGEVQIDRTITQCGATVEDNIIPREYPFFP